MKPSTSIKLLTFLLAVISGLLCREGWDQHSLALALSGVGFLFLTGIGAGWTLRDTFIEENERP